MSFVDPDSEGMLAAAVGLADQVSTALSSFEPIRGLPQLEQLSVVAVMGMGGSAVAGEVLRAFAHSRARVPVLLLNGASPPAYLGPGTLLFAVSYSGNTEETLSVTSAALSSSAHVVAVSAGGALRQRVLDGGQFHLPTAANVSQPRAAAGATIVALLLACEQIGLVEDARRELEAAVRQLNLRRAELEDGGGIALDIARRLGRTIPVFHGADGLGAVAARRWKTQVNENAKAPAYFGVQPEVCHNEVCGFGQNGDVTRQILSLVNLRTGFEAPNVIRRFELFAEMAEEAVAGIIDVSGTGESELASFFDLMTVGDFVSLHLAATEGIDPGPVPVLTELKSRLAGGGE